MLDIPLGLEGRLSAEFQELCAEAGLGGHRFGLRYRLQPLGLPEGSLLLLRGELRAGPSSPRWVAELAAVEALPVVGRTGADEQW